MATEIRWRRGTTAENDAFTGAQGEVTVDTTLNQLRLHDGVTAGGYVFANISTLNAHKADVANPHAVTKTQVGLGNVTDDAQLKIASNLADLANAATARTNLGLGTASVKNTGKTVGDVAVYEDDGSANAVIDHPNMPLVSSSPIVERGSNATGEYVKFADGTQITTQKESSVGTGYTSFTFPASFAAAPYLSVVSSASTSGTLMSPKAHSASTTGASFAVLSGSVSYVATECDIIAFGRWS